MIQDNKLHFLQIYMTIVSRILVLKRFTVSMNINFDFVLSKTNFLLHPQEFQLKLHLL